MEKIKFKKQTLFPFYSWFKEVFPITNKTIFVYKNTIYSDKSEKDWLEYYDVLHHELKHIERMNKLGNDIWIRRYVNDKKFRLEEEKIAYLYQLEKVKEMGDRTELMNIFTEVCQNISSPLYGKMISYRKAEQYFKDNLK